MWWSIDWFAVNGLQPSPLTIFHYRGQESEILTQPSCSQDWPCYTVLANENFLGKIKNLFVWTFSLLPILSVYIITGVARVTLTLSEMPRISQTLSSNSIGPTDPIPAISKSENKLQLYLFQCLLVGFVLLEAKIIPKMHTRLFSFFKFWISQLWQAWESACFWHAAYCPLVTASQSV